MGSTSEIPADGSLFRKGLFSSGDPELAYELRNLHRRILGTYLC
jgi:hypothetical protein